MKRLIVPLLAGVFMLISGCSGPTPVTDFVKCQGDSFRVDLLDAFQVLPDNTPDAHLDQLRDWIWSTLLARLAARSSQPELLVGLIRQPVLRDEGWANFLEQPVGRSRSTIGKDGTVYVLVQRSEPHRTLEDVLEAVDREALALGQQPRALEVYGVDFQMDRAEAQVCKLGSRSAAWITAPEQGFRNRRVTSARELTDFLDGGTDLLTATFKIGDQGRPVLYLTGRQRSRTARAPITIQDLAALGREVRFVPLDRLPAARNLPEEIKADSRRLAAEIDGALRQAAAAGAELHLSGQDGPTQQLLQHVLAWKRQRPGVSTEELILSYRTQDSSDLGFSLDPKTDVAEALRRLDDLISALPSGARLLGVLQGWGTSAEEVLALATWSATDGSLQRLRTSLESLRAAVRRSDSRNGEKLLLEAEELSGDAPFTFLVRQALGTARYQSARYDGPLQGTAPAMTMFYTDLVAKLWAMDWQRSSPTGAVPGFVSVVAHRDSPVFCRDDAGVPSTRIWFGVRPEAYVRDGLFALRLAPGVTRLYARGSALGAGLSPEVEPAAPMQRFIRWWDRHYQDVAVWEPQYERLNQIVKWTLVRRMVETAGTDGLSFLSEVDPGRGQRFDRWMAAQNGLRWRGPVPLLERSSETTETLPLFTSEEYQTCGGPHTLSGGVSLPHTSDIADLPIRQADPRPYLRRLDPLHPATPLTGGSAHYDSLPVPGGRIDNLDTKVTPDGVSEDSALLTEVTIRGDSYALPAGQGPIRRRMEAFVSYGENRSVLRESRDGFGVARIQAEALASNKLRIAVHLGPQSAAQWLSRSVSARMQLGGHDLRSASREVAGDLPVRAVDDGRVIVTLATAEGEEKAFAVLGTGHEGRGPPGPRFLITAPQPVEIARSKGSDGSVELVLLTEAGEQSYLRDHHAAKIEEIDDPFARAVHDHLQAGDFAGARDAVAPQGATPRALARLAVEAAHQDRLDVLEPMVDRLTTNPEAVEEIRHLISELSYRHVELDRKGASAPLRQRLLANIIRLAVAVDRMTPREAAREQAREGDRLPSAYYRLAGGSPQLAHLPPVAYLPSAPTPPGQRYVRELIDLTNLSGDLPESLRFGDKQLRLVRGTAREPAESRVSSAVRRAEPSRLLSLAPSAGSGVRGIVWPLIVVVPCAEEGRVAVAPGDLFAPPACTRATGEERNDPAFLRQAWQAAAALFACDLNGDGQIGGGREEECKSAAVRAHAPVFEQASP